MAEDDGASGTDDTAVAPGALLVGKYRVEKMLGHGGMGVVLLAHDEMLGRRVALKFLHEGLCYEKTIVGRFLREARLAAKIQSEHVARVIDVGTLGNGAPFMVMEYLEGRDLGEVREEAGTLAVPLVLEYLLQACEAIAEAHKLGIVHRDLKPSNLFLTKRADGSPLIKVLDFGISKPTADMNAPLADPGLTTTQNILGSPLYMSPEQLRNAKGVDARADVWSLGVILYELLAGVPPFMGESVAELLVVIVSDKQPPLSSVAPGVPAELSEIVDKCLAKPRDQRFASVSELARRLMPFAPKQARLSVERIARLLGDEQPPESLGTTQVQSGSSGEMKAAALETRPSSPSEAVSLPSVTGVGSQTSTNEPVSSAPKSSKERARPLQAKKRNWIPLAASGAVAFALAIVWIAHAPAQATPTAPASSTTPIATEAPSPPALTEPATAVTLAPVESAPATVDAGATLATPPKTIASTASAIHKGPPASSVTPKPAASARSANAAFDPLGGRN